MFDLRPFSAAIGAEISDIDLSAEQSEMATVVYAQQVPQSGGRTWFANQHAAYEALAEHTRLFIDTLQVIHHYGNRADMDENSRTSALDDLEA